MAQKRMIDKKISVSEDMASLTTPGQLLATWMVPHADDVGLLPYSPRSIKALVVPMNDDFTVESIRKLLESMVEVGYIEAFEWEKDFFWRLVNFCQHQSIKNDRKPQTIAKNINSWKTVESIWKTMEEQGTKELTKELRKKKWEDFKNKHQIKTF